MNPIDFVTALARLLSDPSVRDAFKRDPVFAANQLNIIESDRRYFVNLVPEEVDAQAKLLITKRKREIYRYLPQTFNLIGNILPGLFSDYAMSFWPDSHRRHLDDAYYFCLYLKKRQISFNRGELNHIRFLRSRRRIGLAVARDVLIHGRVFPAIQLFYQFRGISGQFQFYLKP